MGNTNTSFDPQAPDDTFTSDAQASAQAAAESAEAAETAQAAAEAALASTEAALAAQLIEEHFDTTIAGKADGDVLFFDGAAWVNKAYTMGDLNDVDVSGISVDEVLAWDGAQFVPVTVASIADAVALDGDTMTGLLILSGNPVDPLGAATKQYIDSLPVFNPIYAPSSFVNGVPVADQRMLGHIFAASAQFLIGLPDSAVESETAADAETVFDIQKNDVSIGSITFAIAATVATFSFLSDVTFTVGDRMEIIAPSSPDVTLADLYFTIKGVRI